MATLEQFFIHEAQRIATKVEGDAGRLKSDLASTLATVRPIAQAPELGKPEVVSKVGAIEIIEDVAAAALKRANEYVPKVGEQYLCPVCWVKEATKVSLDTVHNGPNTSSFLCRGCDSTFSVTD